ncbi:MAG: TonB family protein [Sphingomonas sp.]|nr:TonB family protein [Sphingomonas sp.]
MPVYASTSGFGAHRRHPRALVLIIGGHAALIAAVMTAKMVIPPRVPDPPIVIDPIKLPPDPPPIPDPPIDKQTPAPPRSAPYVPTPDLPIPTFDGPTIDTTPVPIPDPGPVVGPNPFPGAGPTVTDPPIRIAARFATPEWLIKPPYPADKQRLEEEAVLRLKLSINERGRVTAVEPVGKVDRSFFEAARRHLIANWRYKPATEDGKAVATAIVVTLTFRLED